MRTHPNCNSLKGGLPQPLPVMSAMALLLSGGEGGGPNPVPLQGQGQVNAMGEAHAVIARLKEMRKRTNANRTDFIRQSTRLRELARSLGIVGTHWNVCQVKLDEGEVPAAHLWPFNAAILERLRIVVDPRISRTAPPPAQRTEGPWVRAAAGLPSGPRNGLQRQFDNCLGEFRQLTTRLQNRLFGDFRCKGCLTPLGQRAYVHLIRCNALDISDPYHNYGFVCSTCKYRVDKYMRDKVGRMGEAHRLITKNDVDTALLSVEQVEDDVPDFYDYQASMVEAAEAEGTIQTSDRNGREYILRPGMTPLHLRQPRFRVLREQTTIDQLLEGDLHSDAWINPLTYIMHAARDSS